MSRPFQGDHCLLPPSSPTFRHMSGRTRPFMSALAIIRMLCSRAHGQPRVAQSLGRAAGLALLMLRVSVESVIGRAQDADSAAWICEKQTHGLPPPTIPPAHCQTKLTSTLPLVVELASEQAEEAC